MECRIKIQSDANCLLNFTTPEVPEAFQDDYQHQQQMRSSSASSRRQRYYDDCSATAQQSSNYNKSAAASLSHDHVDSVGVSMTTAASSATVELSPPLGTFKRQRCLRVKQRSGGGGAGARYSSPSDRNCRSEDDRGGRPILRSKSDNSDHYWHHNNSSSSGILLKPSAGKISEKRSAAAAAAATASAAAAAAAAMAASVKSETLSQLERFFDRLGMNEESYEEEIVTHKVQYSSDSDSEHLSSPVFFSDASTVDSTRLPDSTADLPPNSQIFRPSEPPSIVERNARIVKWLCNCRKFQLN